MKIKSKNDRRIILCPLHSLIIRNNNGSEFGWAYDYFSKTHNLEGYEFAYFTGYSDVKSQLIVDLKTATEKNDQKTINADTRHSFLLSIKMCLALIKRKLFHFNEKAVYHHFLPTLLSSTVNLYLLLFEKNYIVGPVQKPLATYDYDLHKKFTQQSKSFWQKIVRVIVCFQAFLSRKFFLKAKYIVAITDETKEYLTTMGIPSKNIIKIPMGINTENYTYFQKHNFDNVSLLTATYLIKRKAVENTILAIHKAIKNGMRNFTLRIVGDGPSRHELEKLVNELGLSKVVFFVGHKTQPELIEIYSKSHVFVNSSRDESFGQTGLEAIASGLAIVSTPVGIFKEIVVDNENGYLCEIDDIDGMAKNLNKIVDNHCNLAKFRNASHRFSENYDWKRSIIPKYLKLYDTIIKD